jgi:capsular exopolysaccharide synthesis family protein
LSGARQGPDSYEEVEQFNPSGGQRSRTDLLTILWVRQNTFALTLVLFLIGGFAYLLHATPIYSSTARICVEQNTPKILTPTDPDMFEKSDSFLYTQAQIVSCVSVLTEALAAPGVSQAHVFDKQDNKLAFLRKTLQVDVGKKDDIISVTFDSPDPKEAALVANAVVDAYVDYESRQNKSTATEILKVLTQEKDKHEAVLEQQEQQLLDFKQNNGDVSFQTGKGNIVMEDLETASNELMQARLDEAAAFALYRSGNDTLVASNELLASREKVQEFEQIYKNQQTKALALSARMAELAKLQSDMDRTTKILDLLDSRMKELNVTEDAGPLNISILEVARPGDFPTFPRKSVVMAVAMILGIIAGAGAAILHEAMDQRLRSADEVAEMLGLSLLAVVPQIRVNEALAGVCELQHSPKSEVSEAFRNFRTAIQFGLPDRTARTILITSPTPGDGKSTTASNLAVAMAQADRRTLLIDADLRRPTQHKNFKLESKIGVSDVLVKRVPIEQAIQRTSVEKLDLLPCGSLPPNPSELINSQAFYDLLMQMSEKYDQVIVDSPPVLPVADARILGALCDITILVLRAEKSTRRGSKHACELLSNVRANLIGIVMNDVSRSRKNLYGYYGYSSYGYSYSYTSREDAPASTNGNGKSHKKISSLQDALPPA